MLKGSVIMLGEWTIKETKKDKTLELHIQYSPLLYIKKKEYALSNVEELENILFNFEISNSGRSEAKKFAFA